ncbi:MBL fold metallo-hydrolase [Chloroflexota bacterium]
MLTHQHYDHIKDIPALAMNLFLRRGTINIYSTAPVFEVVSSYLLDGELYPKFLKAPLSAPTISFTIIEPHQVLAIAGYNIIAVPVGHTVPTVGYQITSSDGKSLFYTGDTGPSLADCWQHISPQLLIIEVTAPNQYEDFGRESGHLTPSLLKQELLKFQETKGYLPQTVLVHMNPALEKEIAAEISAVAESLGGQITLAYEGMQIRL